jgi:toxin-antitoxin system PIN domain toxin
MLVDANLLLYATDARSRFHGPAREWLLERLNGSRRLGLPWQSLAAFLRLSTHPRVAARPLGPDEAWAAVAGWLAAPAAWVPEPGSTYPQLLGEMIVRHDARGNLIPDAQLATLALEHGLTVCSADTDFARFGEIRWENPLA